MAPKKPRVTSSSNRSTRSTTKPVTKGQNPQRANRQKVSQAKVTSDTTRGPSPGRFGQNKQRPGGLAGSGGTGRVTGTAGRPKPATPAKVTTGAGRSAMDVAKARGAAEVAKAQARRGAKAAAQNMASKLSRAKLGRSLRSLGRGGLATAGLTAANALQDRMLSPQAKARKQATALTPVGMQDMPKSVRNALSKPAPKPAPKPKKADQPKSTLTQSSFNKKTFDQAFKAARSSGAKEFTWRGKKYNTKIKGE